ncbi:hypothetical protein GCM10009549_23520 [Streptomyces thermoalcalitolerans]|uniref:TetR family transcriptional regulator n=1 Tax=Streptomyces thermoalcalitolerans TaxID=65605 RepID=A0ABN1NMI3_9ACTN
MENDAEEIGGRRRQRRTTGVPPQPGSAGRIDALEIPVIDASAPFQPNNPRSREALFHLATVTMSLRALNYLPGNGELKETAIRQWVSVTIGAAVRP